MTMNAEDFINSLKKPTNKEIKKKVKEEKIMEFKQIVDWFETELNNIKKNKK